MIPRLIDLVGDAEQDSEIRCNGIVLLGITKIEQARAVLTATLADPDAVLRGAAAVALGEISHRPAVTRLQELLRDTEVASRKKNGERVCDLARAALDKIESPTADTLSDFD